MYIFLIKKRSIFNFSRGSVYVNFTLYFTGLPASELIAIQHAVDVVDAVGPFPVRFYSITSPDGKSLRMSLCFGCFGQEFFISLLYLFKCISLLFLFLFNLLIFVPVPFDPPTFTAESTSQYSIQVKWSRIPDKNLNGNFSYYYIHYRVVSEDPPVWNIMGSKNLSIDLPDLQPGTVYGLRLAVAIYDGRGIATKEKLISTKEGGD